MPLPIRDRARLIIPLLTKLSSQGLCHWISSSIVAVPLPIPIIATFLLSLQNGYAASSSTQFLSSFLGTSPYMAHLTTWPQSMTSFLGTHPLDPSITLSHGWICHQQGLLYFWTIELKHPTLNDHTISFHLQPPASLIFITLIWQNCRLDQSKHLFSLCTQSGSWLFPRNTVHMLKHTETFTHATLNESS